ncbi:uncharacterized protein LOC121268328 isoform X2 [Juglans microcarpa x Juglans regia]|uniref:uncharacterized protein LOC121268328 isoform X2 n=1 Tax=Juglans microcarpa x Juglans regia TaxID=2249226 RepID=UPI001B7E75F7|nr:uncharacterized protein LOC121268328 isoform X2 [Juglans microcarpa x Juglans regia]
MGSVETCGRFDEEHIMTDEEFVFYRNEVVKSEGFDIPSMPDVSSFHMIQPCNLNREDEYILFQQYSQLAIDEYHRRFKDTSAKLELVKVLKTMSMVLDIVRFFITFEAKDLDDGGKTKTYQAVVRMDVFGESVLSFRLKPTEDEQGNLGKEWFWEGHLADGFVV